MRKALRCSRCQHRLWTHLSASSVTHAWLCYSVGRWVNKAQLQLQKGFVCCLFNSSEDCDVGLSTCVEVSRHTGVSLSTDHMSVCRTAIGWRLQLMTARVRSSQMQGHCCVIVPEGIHGDYIAYKTWNFLIHQWRFWQSTIFLRSFFYFLFNFFTDLIWDKCPKLEAKIGRLHVLKCVLTDDLQPMRAATEHQFVLLQIGAQTTWITSFLHASF